MAEMPERPRVSITFCTQCHWMLRAAWMAQELLSTFGTDLGEVALIPGDRRRLLDQGRRRRDLGAQARRRVFPDVKALKGRVCDRLDPDRDLGHLDRERTSPS